MVSYSSVWQQRLALVAVKLTQHVGECTKIKKKLTFKVALVAVVVFTLKTVPISTQHLLTYALIQLTRTPSVVTG